MKFLKRTWFALLVLAIGIIATGAEFISGTGILFDVSPSNLHSTYDVGEVDTGSVNVIGTAHDGKFASASGTNVVVLTSDFPTVTLDGLFDFGDDAETFSFSMNGLFLPNSSGGGGGGSLPTWSVGISGCDDFTYYISPNTAKVAVDEKLQITSGVRSPSGEITSVYSEWTVDEAAVVAGNPDNSKTITLKWNTPGYKYVQGARESNTDKTDSAFITVVEFSDFQYSLNGCDYLDVPESGYITINAHDSITFKVATTPQLTSGEIEWSGVTSGSGFTKTVILTTPSENTGDLREVNVRIAGHEDAVHTAKIYVKDYTPVTFQARVLGNGEVMPNITVYNKSKLTLKTLSSKNTDINGLATFVSNEGVGTENSDSIDDPRKLSVLYNGVEFYNDDNVMVEGKVSDIIISGNSEVTIMRGDTVFVPTFTNYFGEQEIAANEVNGSGSWTATVNNKGYAHFNISSFPVTSFSTTFNGTESYTVTNCQTPVKAQIQTPQISRAYVYQGSTYKEEGAENDKIVNFNVWLCDENGNELVGPNKTNSKGIVSFLTPDGVNKICYKSCYGGYTHVSSLYDANTDELHAGYPDESKVCVYNGTTNLVGVSVKAYNAENNELLATLTTESDGYARAYLPNDLVIRYIYTDGSGKNYSSVRSLTPTDSVVDLNAKAGASVVTVMRGDKVFNAESWSIFPKGYSGEVVQANLDGTTEYQLGNIDYCGEAVFNNLPIYNHTFTYTLIETPYTVESWTPCDVTINLPEFSLVKVQQQDGDPVTYEEVYACTTDKEEIEGVSNYTDHRGITKLVPGDFDTLKFKVTLNGIDFWSNDAARNSDTVLTIPNKSTVKINFNEEVYKNVQPAEYEIIGQNGYTTKFSYEFGSTDPDVSVFDSEGNVIVTMAPSEAYTVTSSTYSATGCYTEFTSVLWEENGYEVVFANSQSYTNYTESVSFVDFNGETLDHTAESSENPSFECENGYKVYFYYEDGDEYARAALVDSSGNLIDTFTVDAEDDSFYVSESGRKITFDESENGSTTTVQVLEADDSLIDQLIIYNGTALENGYRVLFYYDEESEYSKAKIFDPDGLEVADLTVDSEDDSIYISENGYSLKFAETETTVTLSAYDPDNILLDSLTVDVSDEEEDDATYYLNGHFYNFTPATLELSDAEGNVVQSYEVSGDGEADLYLPEGYTLKYTDTDGRVYEIDADGNTSEYIFNPVVAKVKVARIDSSGTFEYLEDQEIIICDSYGNSTGDTLLTDSSGSAEYNLNEGVKAQFKTEYNSVEYSSRVISHAQDVLILIDDSERTQYHAYLRLSDSKLLKITPSSDSDYLDVDLEGNGTFVNAINDDGNFIKEYKEPGEYVYEARVDANQDGDYDDDNESGIFVKVSVITVDFNGPIACERYFTRIKESISVVGIDQSEVDFSIRNGRCSKYSAKCANETVTLRLQPFRNYDCKLTAKLSGCTIPVNEIDIDTFYLRHVDDYHIYASHVYEDGTYYCELHVGMTPHVPNLEYEVAPWTGNTGLMEGGVAKKRYSTNDMYASEQRAGEYIGDYGLIINPQVNLPSHGCHDFSMYQDNVKIGSY